MKKKIFFWLNANIIDFCVSYYLQKITDAEFYAIIDVTNKPKKFFKEQKLVLFKKIWFYHDHIKTHKSVDLDNLENIALVHIDCDLYSSTKYVLDTLKKNIDNNCIIVFDEIVNYINFLKENPS